MKINLVARSVFVKEGHGVYTAFRSQVDGLRRYSGVELSVDSLKLDHDILHLHTYGWAALWRVLLTRSEVVMTVHVIPESLVGSIKGARFWLPFMRAYMKFIYSRADLILPVSPMAAESLRSMGIKKPIKVLYNGIEMSNFITSKSDRISAKQALNLLEKSFVVVGNGQIQARKRFDLFCEVAEQLPDMAFIWVGGSPFGRLSDDYTRLQQLVDNPPRNVIVTGVVPYSEVGKYMRAADVFWLPSNQENHPMAALEAAGIGIPLLMRDIAEYDKSFGQDIIRGDDLTFKDQLLKLRDDRSFYQAGLNGSKRIAKRYDNQTIISTLIEHYKSLLNNP